ncbi:MAG: heme ABC exporter ATP-binding protein CcmA [Phenylobacterium sp.]|nr:heme ABC exporter ATP-binding protein CcmA [Phenylobacterium sp.]
MISRLVVSGLGLQRGERVLVTGVGFELQAGQAMALTGPNGSGKTTLLRALAGLIRPVAGEIAFEGPSGLLDPIDARQQDLHLLGHQDGLKTSRTAREELAFQVAWTGGSTDSAVAAAERLDLVRFLDLDVRRLSAGQRRRLALARLVASPRALWLLDEPLAPLDSEHRRQFGALMAEHLAGGGLILAAVHDPLPIDTLSLDLAA